MAKTPVPALDFLPREPANAIVPADFKNGRRIMFLRNGIVKNAA
jgi:hypothetical protein